MSVDSAERGANLDDITGTLPEKPGRLLCSCRGKTLITSGNRSQLFKILAITLIPILGLWTFIAFSLSDTINGKAVIEQTQYAVKFSVEIGQFLDRIQRERDMSVLYLSILGPGTKTFLLNEYLLTDNALERLSDWPVRNDVNPVFHSKKSFHKFLQEHREVLDPSNFDIYVEIEFYSFLIERFVEWMYDSIKESKMASSWKILVSYQKIVTGMEQVGIERALGAVYYLQGGFPSTRYFENYNSKVHVFKSNYRSAVLYSDIIDPLFQKSISSSGTNLTAVIEVFRSEVQHDDHIKKSIVKGQWWFDNMTLYLNSLLLIQIDLSMLINDQLEEIIEAEDRRLGISAIFLAIVVMMCPIVIYTVEGLTSGIHKYAVTLGRQTSELVKEKKKTDNLLYQMFPSAVANKLQMAKHVDAEYYKLVTVMFSDIFGFTQISIEFSALEIVDLLNSLYAAIDEQLDSYEVYKVETINDSYMVASGLPNRIGNRHSAEIAWLALKLLDVVKTRPFPTPNNETIQLRFGINSGPCMAGIVGTIMPRYCLFGDTINTASRMKTNGLPNKIHISASTHRSLKEHKRFSMKHRGNIQVKGKGSMKTYWLLGKNDGSENDPSINTRTVENDVHERLRFLTLRKLISSQQWQEHQLELMTSQYSLHDITILMTPQYSSGHSDWNRSCER